MNQADYLYLDREKGRIEHELHNALESDNKNDILEVVARVEEYKRLKFGPEEPVTVKSLLQELSELSQATTINDIESGEPVSLDEFQDMIFHRVDQLADMFGVELEG